MNYHVAVPKTGPSFVWQDPANAGSSALGGMERDSDSAIMLCFELRSTRITATEFGVDRL